MRRDGVLPEKLKRSGGARLRPKRSVRDELHVTRGGTNEDEARSWNGDIDAMFSAGLAGTNLPKPRSESDAIYELRCRAYDELVAAVSAQRCDFVVCRPPKIPHWVATAQITDELPNGMEAIKAGAAVRGPLAIPIRTRGSRRRAYIILIPPTHPAAVDGPDADEARTRLEWELIAPLVEPAVTTGEIRRRRWRWRQRTHF